MSNKNSNYPTNGINNLPQEECKDTMTCILEISKQGKVNNASETQERINQYFNFCADNGFRCGIESLCVALGVTRTTFWNWCRGDGCSHEQAEICRYAKQIIIAFIEQASLSGKLNPATSCFMLKNWASYKDTLSFEETTTTTEYRKIKSLDDIRKERVNLERTNLRFDFDEIENSSENL